MYVVGYIEKGPTGNMLCPFFVPKTDSHDKEYDRIKIRLDGNHANVFYPITVMDPMFDSFFKPYPAELIREFKIKREPTPLIPAKHTQTPASLRASSSSS